MKTPRKASATSAARIAGQISGRLPGLTGEQARKLAGIARQHSYAAGKAIFKCGDEGKEIYMLLKGRIALKARFGTHVDLVTFSTVSPMELFGWSSLTDKPIKTACADVVEDAQVLAFQAKELLALCDADPTLGYVVMRALFHTVSQRLIATRHWVLDLLT
jgi:CRP-like cAMP-binding protein